MNKKLKIGFIAFHPGATNTLTKIIHKLKTTNHEIVCFPFLEYARKEWDIEGDIFKDSMDFFEKIDKDFDVIFYSSAADSFVENNLPLFCKENNILCISTIDVFWINEIELKRRFKVLPDVIITPDNSILQMIKKLEWNVEVYNFGNPHLEINKNETNKKIFDNKNKVLNYISFPATNDVFSYTDDKSIEIINDLLSVIKTNHSISKLYISLHPREDKQIIQDILNNNSDIKNKVLLNPYNSTTECSYHSDIIIGYTSTVLYEELLKDKQVIFYKDKISLIDLLNSEKIIKNEIKFELPTNCVENIINFIENYSK